MREHIIKKSVSNMVLTFDDADGEKDTCRAFNTDAGGWYESKGKVERLGL